MNYDNEQDAFSDLPEEWEQIRKHAQQQRKAGIHEYLSKKENKEQIFLEKLYSQESAVKKTTPWFKRPTRKMYLSLAAILLSALTLLFYQKGFFSEPVVLVKAVTFAGEGIELRSFDDKVLQLQKNSSYPEGWFTMPSASHLVLQREQTFFYWKGRSQFRISKQGNTMQIKILYGRLFFKRARKGNEEVVFISENLEISPIGTSGEIMIDKGLERISVLHGSFHLKQHGSQELHVVKQGEKINVYTHLSKISLQKFRLSKESLEYLQRFPTTLVKKAKDSAKKGVVQKERQEPSNQYGTIQTVISNSGIRYTGYVYYFDEYILIETQSQKVKIAREDIRSIE
ncbi:MAG: hypothetical protein AAF518_19680 [Spirochaetota bacterium]